MLERTRTWFGMHKYPSTKTTIQITTQDWPIPEFFFLKRLFTTSQSSAMLSYITLHYLTYIYLHYIICNILHCVTFPEWCGKLSLLFQTQNLSGDWLKVILPESVFVGGAPDGCGSIEGGA